MFRFFLSGAKVFKEIRVTFTGGETPDMTLSELKNIPALRPVSPPVLITGLRIDVLTIAGAENNGFAEIILWGMI